MSCKKAIRGNDGLCKYKFMCEIEGVPSIMCCFESIPARRVIKCLEESSQKKICELRWKTSRIKARIRSK